MADFEQRSLTRLQIVGAVAAGLILACLPLARFVLVAGHGAAHGSDTPHADHEPRHGGQLGMSGDHHIEVRLTPGGIEAFVSDALRRPVRASRAWVRLDGAERLPLEIRDDRLIGRAAARPREVETVVILPSGERLAITFDFGSQAAHAGPPSER